MRVSQDLPGLFMMSCCYCIDVWYVRKYTQLNIFMHSSEGCGLATTMALTSITQKDMIWIFTKNKFFCDLCERGNVPGLENHDFMQRIALAGIKTGELHW